LDAGTADPRLYRGVDGLLVSFFENFIQIAFCCLPGLLVLLAFFMLAIQLFVTLIEFKLTTLCGFVLIPFGLFGKTAFMAERVLGNVVSSGIKVLVLAVIIGIGSTLFAEFTAAFRQCGTHHRRRDGDRARRARLLGLGIFGPGIANGIVSGGPQLGAGAAAGTALAAGGLAAGGIAGARLAAGAATSAASGIAQGGAKAAGGGAMAYSLGSAGKSGASGVASGIGAVGQAAAGAATSPLRKAASAVKSSFRDGARGAVTATGGTITGGAPEPSEPEAKSGGAQPAWAKAMKNRQTISHGATIAAHTLRSGDGGGAGSSVDVTEKE
jgi:type IV secretion system protein TrbL